MTSEALKQIVYALQRQANALQAQADRLSDQLDYSAEFPAEDAQRMREAIRIIGEPRVLGAGLDPWPNPGDPVISDALRAPDDARTALLDLWSMHIDASVRAELMGALVRYLDETSKQV